MRTHFLNQLPIEGRERVLAVEPNFDFYGASRVSGLKIDFPAGDATVPTLQLVLQYHVNRHPYDLTMVLSGVRELVIPRMSPRLSLPELEIEDVGDRLMEGVRFEVISHFERAFRCTCHNIEILEFQPQHLE